MKKVIGLGDVVYWARVHHFTGTYELYKLIVRTVYEDCFVGTDKDTSQAFIISYDECDETVFDNREDALAVVKNAEKNKKKLTVDESMEEDDEDIE